MAVMRSSWSRAKRAYRPGQACVFYDAASGQARVLGGGFIQSATAQERDGQGASRSQPLAEAMRG